ncbi:MAG: hypothetical protein ACK4RK_16915 [Gemmataceae bacterium]
MTRVAFSPDGKHIVSSSKDKTLKWREAVQRFAGCWQGELERPEQGEMDTILTIANPMRVVFLMSS